MKRTIVFAAAAAAILPAVAGNVPAYPYGVCAHITRGEGAPGLLKGTLDAMEAAGMRYVRSDFDAPAMLGKDGTWGQEGHT